MICLGAMKVAGCVLLLLAAVAAVLATDDHLFGTPEGRKYLQYSSVRMNACLCTAVSALSVQYSTELAGTCRALMFHVNFRLPVLIPPEQLLVAITGRIYTILEDEGRHGAVLL